MPKFPTGYTAKTTPVDNDKVLIADSAASDAIKPVTIVNLVENRIVAILQTVTSWVTTAMISNTAVTYAKVDPSTFPPAIYRTFNGEQGINTGALKAVSIDLVANVNYLILGSVQWTSSGGPSGIKLMALRINGSTIDDHRIESSSQAPMLFMGTYRPATSGTYTFDVYLSNITGSQFATVGNTRYHVIPITSTQPIA